MAEKNNNPLIATNIRLKYTKILLVIISFLLVLVSGLSARSAEAASLYLSPSSDSFNVGEQFSVSVYVSSADQAMNAASGIISFPQDKLGISSISKSGSIISLWVQEPAFFNNAGTANFEGIVLNPGFTGSSGKIITLNFRAKAVGNASLTFSSGSVLANDGKGTNILTGMSEENYNIQAGTIAPPGEAETEEIRPSPTIGIPLTPKISSPTHPDPEKWYSNNDPEFTWKLPSDATGVSLLLNEEPTANPGNISDGLLESKKYENVEDGIWYLHIKFKNQYGWGKITHHKVLIDTVPPLPFEIQVQKEDATDPQPLLPFETKDELSGLEYYEIKIGEGDVFPVSGEITRSNPYHLAPLAPGKHKIEIKAFDKAQNYSLATTQVEISAIEAPIITKYPKRLNLGEELNLEGTGLTEAAILVFVQQKGKEPIMGETKANGDGIWQFSLSKTLEKGEYKAWAQARDKRGALSLSSQPISFEVGLPPFLKFGKIVIDYLTIMITLIVLVIGAIAIIFYVWYRISLWRRNLKKETGEIKESVIRAFRALREEVQEQIDSLDNKPGLTKKEKEVRDKLKEALDISEEFISKEIKDVEKNLE